MSPDSPASVPERWAAWQWVVIAVLGLGVVGLGSRLALDSGRPEPSPSFPLGFIPLTLEQEIASYQRQLGPTRSNFLALNRLADASIRQARATGDPAWYLRAELDLRTSLTLLPTGNSEAEVGLARVMLARHDFAGARALLARAARDSRWAAECMGLLFDIAMAQGDLPAARAALPTTGTDGISDTRRALYADATGDEPAVEAGFKAAYGHLEGADAESRAWSLVAWARALIGRGRDEEAGRRLDQALTILPAYMPALLGRAELARRAGRWPEVFTQLEKANVALPQPDIQLRLREASAALGRPADAQRWLADARRLLDQEVAAGGFGHRSARVRMLLAAGRAEDLVEAGQQIAAERRERADLETLVLEAEVAVRRRAWPAARRALDLAAATGSGDARIAYWRARIAEGSGDAATARRLDAAARARDPRIVPPAAANDARV